MKPPFQKTIEKLTESTTKFLDPLTLEGTYKTIVSEAIKLTKAEFGTIFLERNGELERVYSTVPKIYQVAPRKDGYNSRVFKSGKPILIKRASFLSIHPDFKNPTASFIIGVALRNRGKSIGTLFLQSKRKESFTKFDLEILSLLGTFASLAIRKAELYTEVKNALDTRDIFIATANHEIKTPLTAINIYSQMIKNSVSKGSPPKPEWVDKMTAEIKRVAKLLSELLKIEQINTGDMAYVLKPTSISKVVKNAVDIFMKNNPKRIVHFSKNLNGSSDIIPIDQDKITQALLNLLNNAAKFSPANKQIEVYEQIQNGKLIIKVADKGAGIPHDMIPNIFKGFFKGDPTKPGFGLGLYLTKRIIERHNGEIIVSSKPNQGTIMQLTFPINSND